MKYPKPEHDNFLKALIFYTEKTLQDLCIHFYNEKKCHSRERWYLENKTMNTLFTNTSDN